MTPDEITQIARDAGLHVNGDGAINHAHFGSVNEGYRKFAEILLHRQLEKYISALEQLEKSYGTTDLGLPTEWYTWMQEATRENIAAIRARGNT